MDIEVQKEFQQKGIGTELLNHAEEYASKKGLFYLFTTPQRL
jgi:ribosomal protein S18 acetylase RimI-like enzyme